MKKIQIPHWFALRVPCIVAAAVVSAHLLLPGHSADGQDLFVSGSTGADGALEISAPSPGRSFFHMSYNTARNACFLFGGWNGTEAAADSWDFNGTEWRDVQPVFSPVARTVYAMTYDSVRNIMVLYGGFDAEAPGQLSDTWHFKDDRWTQILTPTNPGNAIFRSMAFDINRQRTVMFGGLRNPDKLQETWEYDGTDWTLAATNGPSARSESVMAFDSSRNTMVLFGGSGETNLLNDTWEYNGTWTQRTFGGADLPSPRRVSAMTFDSQRNRMVLFGGNDGVLLNDTWEYNGVTWTKRAPATTPAPRSDHAICYDPVRQRTLLFGGADGNFQFNETWEWDGTDWVLRTEFDDHRVIDMNDKPDGVWNYSSINIGAGVTVSFARNSANTPVVWLATTNVVIDGTVDISGEHGANVTAVATRAAGGPGGFDGGLGGLFFSEDQKSGEPGLGPGGGLPGINSGEDGGDAGFATAGDGAFGGNAYGNIFNAPIIGGSGGGGGAAVVTNTTHGGLGGGGGGALMIASSETITLNGTINADGGDGEVEANAGDGGTGSGGAVRLVADRVEGSGTITAGDNGRIRTEGFVVALDQVFTPIQSQAPPYEVDLTGQGLIRITQVDGALVRANPLGDIGNPDVVFTNTGPVTISLETENIPLGTLIDLRITSGSAVITNQSNAVSGSVANGNASATATVPAGSGTIQAFAEFTN